MQAGSTCRTDPSVIARPVLENTVKFMLDLQLYFTHGHAFDGDCKATLVSKVDNTMM